MNKQTLLAMLLACTASFFWAANAIVGKIVIETLPAFTLSQFRWLLAFLILAPFGLGKIKTQWSWYKENFWPLVGLSILSVTLYNTLQYWALEYTQPVTVGALLAMPNPTCPSNETFLNHTTLSVFLTPHLRLPKNFC